MSARLRRSGAWALGALLCTLLAALGLDLGPGATALAQQDNWTTEASRRMGIQLLETRDASGPPAYPVAPGDLLFFTNVGTSYGAKNPRNSVVVINAKTRKPIAVSDLEPGWSERWTSHGIGVSPDGKYVYLPGISPRTNNTSNNPSSILVLDARTLKIYQIISSGAERPHHVKQYEDWSGKPRMLVEDFNWMPAFSPNGKGFYILDPSDNNKVVAGMTPGDIRGHPYAGFTSPDGRYLYYSQPASDFSLRTQLQGLLIKIDMQTWKLEQSIPMDVYPIWTVFSQDGKWAWVTNSHHGKVLKIQRAAAPGQIDKVVAEVPTGPGPYGLAMSLDDKDLWVADKGETLPGQRGTSITIIDAETNQVKRTLQTKCITNDHLILSPDGQEMWATCNQSHEVVVLDTKTYDIKTRIPMPNQGDSHGGSFVSYTKGSGGIVAEVVSDQNGLHGSARDARRKGTTWVAGGSR